MIARKRDLETQCELGESEISKALQNQLPTPKAVQRLGAPASSDCCSILEPNPRAAQGASK